MLFQNNMKGPEDGEYEMDASVRSVTGLRVPVLQMGGSVGFASLSKRGKS